MASAGSGGGPGGGTATIVSSQVLSGFPGSGIYAICPAQGASFLGLSTGRILMSTSTSPGLGTAWAPVHPDPFPSGGLADAAASAPAPVPGSTWLGTIYGLAVDTVTPGSLILACKSFPHHLLRLDVATGATAPVPLVHADTQQPFVFQLVSGRWLAQRCGGQEDGSQ